MAPFEMDVLAVVMEGTTLTNVVVRPLIRPILLKSNTIHRDQLVKSTIRLVTLLYSAVIDLTTFISLIYPTLSQHTSLPRTPSQIQLGIWTQQLHIILHMISTT